MGLSSTLKEEVTALLERKFGEWMEQNVDLIKQKIPITCKIYPMFCGSMVEGFLTKGSDVDFSVIIDDRKEKPLIRGTLSRTFKQLINDLEEEVKTYGLDHMCGMSRKIRTTTYLLGFENCRNPQFRMNYFLFGKLINPIVRNREIKKRLATDSEFLSFKRELQHNYRSKYGYELPRVERKVLANPSRYGPKRAYRETQLVINSFLMAYGLTAQKLTEKMDKELVDKALEITKSNLMRNARTTIETELKDAMQKLFLVKEKGKIAFKRKRLKFLKEHGLLTDEEWRKIQTILIYFLEYVYEPLINFYEIQVKLTDLLRDDFNLNIQWIGLRKDHAYITLQGYNVKCLDIIPRTEGKYEVYVVVSREVSKELMRKKYTILFETKGNLGSLNLPHKLHKPGNKGRKPHFLIFTANAEELNDLRILKEKLQQALDDLSQVK